MAPTPYPQNLFHTGTAKPLALDVALDVPPTGDIIISVAGNAASKGWPAIPGGQKMVITLGRATQYETKYLVSSISSGSTSSTLTVAAVDRNYDGMVPQNAPAGTTVEHTVSATEMSTINDHMRTKRAHGSDGDLVDQDSSQTLTHKTLSSPSFSGTVGTDIAMGSHKITGLDAGSAASDAVRFDQVPVLTYVYGERKSPHSTQVIEAGTAELLTFPSETDPSDMLSSGEVTIPTSGLWLLVAGVYVESTSAITFELTVARSNIVSSGTIYPVQTVTTHLPSGSSTYFGNANVSALLMLNAADTMGATLTNYASAPSGLDATVKSAFLSVVKLA